MFLNTALKGYLRMETIEKGWDKGNYSSSFLGRVMAPGGTKWIISQVF